MSDIAELISRHLDHTLTPDEAHELNAWIGADPENARRFAHEAFVHSCTRDLLVGEHYLRRQIEPGNFATSLNARSGEESQVSTRRPLQARRWLVAASIIVAFAIGMEIWRPWRSTPTLTPTVLTAAVDPQWDGAAPSPGSALPDGSRLALKSGFIQITLAGGGEMIVEGPATFTKKSPNSYFLERGKIAATVPGGGLIVETPTARLTDLGTQFGVSVTSAGTRIEVFEGKVQAAPTAASGSSESTILTAGQAAQIADGRIDAQSEGAIPQHFVLSLVNYGATLDVVDLLAGGDGTSHRRGLGIDMATGNWGLLAQAGSIAADGQYHTVPALPVVDGVFVPDGGKGPVTVDSQGHQYPLHTSFNGSFMNLWAGGAIPDPPRIPPGNASMSPVLAGIDYSQDGHGLLAMHSNKGTTLDLAAIRHLHPGISLVGFRSLVGNSWLLHDNSPAAADAYVLVDGQVRFAREKFTARDGAIGVLVPLRDQDRFLTLVVTDGGDSTITFDHVLWADPLLELKTSGH